ncbi:MAG: hypothetical protein WB474_07175 [Nitrososphaeraceae archaeon]
MDFTLISASIVTGVITSIIFNGLMGHGQDKSKGKSDISQLSSSAANIQVLESLKIENDIIKEGIAKIYEAFSGDKISKLEYDRLMVKYTEDLRICDERIKDLQPIIDIFELKDLRNGLVSLIENRIKNIDEKLDKLSSTTMKSYGIRTSGIDPISKGSRHVKPDAIKSQKFGDQILQSARLEQIRIERLQKEVLAALFKLDKSSENHSSDSSNANKDLPIRRDGELESITFSEKLKRDALCNFS